MNFSMQVIFLQGAILCFSAFVQATTGFAFSLFSNTLLLFTGLPLPCVVLLSTLGSSWQRILMTGSMWRHIAWRTILPLSAICIVTLPLGTLLLRKFAQLDQSYVKAGIGVLVLVVLLVQILWKIKPRAHLHWFWGVITAATSGVLNGFSNNGGPPLVLWVHAHDWPTERSRVTPLAITLLLTPFQLGLLFGVFQSSIMPTIGQWLMLLPAITVGTIAGLLFGKRLSRQHLRGLVMGLLAILAISAICEPALRYFMAKT